jgi:hypothetical protein
MTENKTEHCIFSSTKKTSTARNTRQRQHEDNMMMMNDGDEKLRFFVIRFSEKICQKLIQFCVKVFDFGCSLVENFNSVFERCDMEIAGKLFVEASW